MVTASIVSKSGFPGPMPTNQSPLEEKLLSADMKPVSPLDVPNPMRYLVVPSQETETWKEYLISKGWLERKYNIQIEGDRRAIPLSNLIPENLPEKLLKFDIIEKEVSMPLPTDYLGYLEKNIGKQIFRKFEKYWPQSFDRVGEIIIVKIPQEIENYSKNISSALLSQNPKATRVFQDLGVEGDFRIRNLLPIDAKNEGNSETKIKENGAEFFVDPTKGYFSPRLATERMETLECARLLKNKLGRKLNICDAYAGFGPALIILLNEKELVNSILANDLNAQVTNLLEKNLTKVSKGIVPVTVQCIDARDLTKNPKNKNFYDLLLVNIPHSTLEHLPLLIDLLKNDSVSLLKAWCIIDSTQIELIKMQISKMFDSSKHSISKISIDSSRSYSPTQIYAKIEIWLN